MHYYTFRAVSVTVRASSREAANDKLEDALSTVEVWDKDEEEDVEVSDTAPY